MGVVTAIAAPPGHIFPAPYNGAGEQVRFYDDNGVLIQTFTTAATGTNANRIVANDLNFVPDFIGENGETVVLSWKLKGGADVRYNILRHVIGQTGVTNIPPGGLDLEPFLTMPKAELFGILALDGHMDTAQAVVDDGYNHWLPITPGMQGLPVMPPSVTAEYNCLSVAPDNPTSRWPWSGSNPFSSWYTFDGATSRPRSDIYPRTYATQALFPYMVQGGQGGGLFTAFTGSYGLQDISRGSGDLGNSKTLSQIHALHWTAYNSNNKINNPNAPGVNLVTEAAGFLQAHEEGNLAIMQFIESAYGLTPENYYELIEQYYDLGIRGLSFTWNASGPHGVSTPFATAANTGDWTNPRAANNTVSPVLRIQTGLTGAPWGSNWPRVPAGAGGTAANTEPMSNRSTFFGPQLTAAQLGLQPMGVSAIRRMEELGMFYCMTHQHANTIRDVLDISVNPILNTHAGAAASGAALDQFVRVAEAGGVFARIFAGTSYAMVDNLEAYVNALVSRGFSEDDAWNHVAFGSDMDGGVIINDISDSRYYYRLAKEMFARGYPLERVERVLHGNFIRVIETVEGNATISDRDGTAEITDPTVDGMNLGRGRTLPQISKRDPSFSANVSGAVSGRVIVDGLVIPSILKDGVLTATLEGAPLQEKYHVVTFEATDADGNRTRETNIFYTGHLPEIHRIEVVTQTGVRDVYDHLASVYVNDRERLDADALPSNVLMYRHWWTAAIYDPNAASIGLLTNHPVMRSVRLAATEVLGEIEVTLSNEDGILTAVFTLTNGAVPVNFNADRLSALLKVDGASADALTFEGYDAATGVAIWTFTPYAVNSFTALKLEAIVNYGSGDWFTVAGDVSIHIVSAVPRALVEQIPGNQNWLNVWIDEVFSDGTTNTIHRRALIDNNAIVTWVVGSYEVRVDTKGNTQIRDLTILQRP